MAQQFEIIKSIKPKKPSTGEYFRKEKIKRVFMTSNALYDLIKNDNDLKWIKFQKKIHAESVEYINENVILSLSWHFYRSELTKIGKADLITQYNLNDAIYCQEELKQISNYVLYNAVADFSYIVGIDQLYGWRTEVSDTEIIEKVGNWVQNDFKPNYKGSEDEFNKRFREKIRDILQYKEQKQDMKTTAEDYCYNIASQGTTGAAFDPGSKDPNLIIEDVDRDVKVKYRKTKYTKSASLSVNKKIKRLFAKTKGRAKVSHKVEIEPKVRIIVGADYNTTLKMRFIDEWLQEWMSGVDLSTLFMTSSQRLRMWRRFADNKIGCNVPIDQSAFDHHVTKKMVLIIIEEIYELIKSRGKNIEELLAVMETIIYDIENTRVEYSSKDGSTRYWDYQSGVLSGWQWTALIDTLANIAEFRIMIDLMADNGIKANVLLFNAQGDDDLVKMETPASCLALISAYNMCGFEVHPRKTFISSKHNEYLRKYSNMNEINGYPARMVTKLLWLYPGDSLPYSASEKLSTTLSKWKSFNERMKGTMTSLLKYVNSEYNAMKIPVALVKEYLTTSQVYGGSGLIDTDVNREIIKKEIDEEKETKLRFINDQGYQDFRLRFGAYQTREMDEWFRNLINITDKRVLDDDRIDIVTRPRAAELQEYKFSFVPTKDKPRTERNDKYPPNVVFGQSKDLMAEVFPRIDSFVDMGRAPKSWIYDYLAGKVKTVSPKVTNMSDEMSALLFNEYSAGMINAMYYKKNRTEKWNGLNLYAERNFSNYILNTLHDLPVMRG